MNAEVTLWRAVIAQAFIDAAGAVRTGADRLARVEARDWLLKDNPGFRAICEAADVAPHTVRRNAERQALLGWPVKREAIGHKARAERTARNEGVFA